MNQTLFDQPRMIVIVIAIAIEVCLLACKVLVSDPDLHTSWNVHNQ